MKKVGIVLWVGAGLYAVWSIVMLIMNAVSYSSYIEYYGLGQVLPSILDGFFAYASWAFLLFGLGALIKNGLPSFKEPQAAAIDDTEAIEYGVVSLESSEEQAAEPVDEEAK